LATSFIVAWLSYHVYEKHFLRLKTHFKVNRPADLDVSADGAGLGPAIMHGDRIS
jgi:hypothetical protein